MITRPWLPHSALRDGRLTSAVGVLVDDWAKRWLPQADACAVEVDDQSAQPAVPSDGLCWTTTQHEMAISLDGAAAVPLAARMIGLPNTLRCNGADKELLAALSALCLEDLLGRAIAVFGIGGSIVRARGRVCMNDALRHSITSNVLPRPIELFVSASVAATARKAMLSAPQRRRELQSRRTALARQRIQVGARIGVSTLALGEVRSLAHGDVVVLDRGPVDAVDIAINRVCVGPEAGTLFREGEALNLRAAQHLSPS